MSSSRRKPRPGTTPAAPGPQEAAAREDPGDLSPPMEAALHAHSLALQGMQRLHLDLAERLEAGERLRQRVDQVADEVARLAEEQRRLARRVVRWRRPARGAAAWVAGIVLLGCCAWVAGRGGLGLAGDEAPPGNGSRGSAWSSEGSTAEGLRAGALAVDGPGADGAGGSGPEGAAQAAHGFLGESPGLVSLPLPLEEQRRLLEQLERAQASMEAARDERNKQLGESARLRQELIAQQLRFDELTKAVEAARLRSDALAEGAAADGLPAIEVGAPVAGRGSEVGTASDALLADPAVGGPSLVSALNGALARCGLRDLQLVEVGRARAEQLDDLLVIEYDRVTGRSEIYPADHARLVAASGVVQLELSLVGPQGEPAEVRSHALPQWDAQAWEGCVLQPPKAFLPVAEVEESLRRLLASHHYELVSLGGYEGGVLRDVVVHLVDSQGAVLLTYVAQRGEVLEEGPELLLRDGSVLEDGVERPFWRGQSRLPLPGSSYADWQRSVGG